MDQAWMSLQHPYPHQHFQQHQWQHLQQQQLSAVGSDARVIPHIPKRRAAERHRYRGTFHPGQEQHAVQHLPAQVDSFQILLPVVYLPPLHLQPLSPDVATEALYGPYASQQSYWPSMPTYSYSTQPYIQLPFSSLPEAMFNPWLLSPILCPHMVPLHQTHYAEEVYVSTTTNVTTASQWTKVHTWSGGQGSMSRVKEDQKNKAHKDNPSNESCPGNEANTDNKGNAGNEDKTPEENIPADLTEYCDRPGPPASLDEEAVNKDSFEECFRLLESFFDQLLPNEAEEPREEEHGEAGYRNMENSSFLEYLDELCRDEEFVSKVESTVDIELLMSPLSASQDLFEEQQETQELNKPRKGETKRKMKEPGMKGGEKKTLEQEVRARKENRIKVKSNVLVNLGQRISSKVQRQKDKEREKLQEKQGAQLFKRKRSQDTKLTSTAEQPLETTKKKQLQIPNLEAGKHGEPTFIFRCGHDARPSGSLPTTCPEITNTFERIFWDTWPQVQKSTVSSHKPSLGASPDLTVSPAKKRRQACQATRKRGRRSADRAGTEQRGPNPRKKNEAKTNSYKQK